MAATGRQLDYLLSDITGDFDGLCGRVYRHPGKMPFKVGDKNCFPCDVCARPFHRETICAGAGRLASIPQWFRVMPGASRWGTNEQNRTSCDFLNFNFHLTDPFARQWLSGEVCIGRVDPAGCVCAWTLDTGCWTANQVTGNTDRVLVYDIKHDQWLLMGHVRQEDGTPIGPFTRLADKDGRSFKLFGVNRMNQAADPTLYTIQSSPAPWWGLDEDVRGTVLCVEGDNTKLGADTPC